MSKQITDQENIDKFIDFIDSMNIPDIARGNIINWLNREDHKELWKYVIKALVVATDDYSISKQYLLQKLEYCRENLETPHAFLDVFRLNVFTELCRNANIFF